MTSILLPPHGITEWHDCGDDYGYLPTPLLGVMLAPAITAAMSLDRLDLPDLNSALRSSARCSAVGHPFQLPSPSNRFPPSPLPSPLLRAILPPSPRRSD